jgi:hypothetical protein
MSQKFTVKNNEKTATLFRQLEAASQKDMTPYRPGAEAMLISLLGADFPEVALVKNQTVPLDGQGWISGDLLHQIAELSENEACGLVELQGSDRKALILGLNPGEELWNNLLLKNLRGQKRATELCSFWGPCLGQKIHHLDLLKGLLEDIAPILVGDFRVSAAACTRDCRLSLERCDVALLLSDNAKALDIWLGGRHKPFGALVTPVPVNSLDISLAPRMVKLIERVNEFHLDKANAEESFPELMARLGQDGLSHLTELIDSFKVA